MPDARGFFEHGRELQYLDQPGLFIILICKNLKASNDENSEGVSISGQAFVVSDLVFPRLLNLENFNMIFRRPV